MAREGRKRRCEGLAERALPGEWGRGPRPGGGVGVGRRRSRRPSRSGLGARRAVPGCSAGPGVARRRVGERRLLLGAGEALRCGLPGAWTEEEACGSQCCSGTGPRVFWARWPSTRA